MAYKLQLDTRWVLAYLRNVADLPREVRTRLFTLLHEDLAVHGDEYRSDPDRRVSPGSDSFVYEIALEHGEFGYLVRFVVSDEAAAYGVLRVRFVTLSRDFRF